MKRIVGMLCVVCGLAAAVVVRAQTSTPPTYVLTTVDAIQRYGANRLNLSGVLEGASSASVVQMYTDSNNIAGLESCERYATAMMNKPGQYRLEIWQGSTYSTGYCRITKLDP